MGKKIPVDFVTLALRNPQQEDDRLEDLSYSLSETLSKDGGGGDGGSVERRDGLLPPCFKEYVILQKTKTKIKRQESLAVIYLADLALLLL